MDTVADLLSQIKNGYMAGKNQIVVPWSKLRENLVKKLVDIGYLKDIEVKKDEKKRKKIEIRLRYDNQGRPVVTEIKRISKPGCRIYTTVDKIPITLGGTGTTILSTSKGIMTGQEARRENVGGEVMCQLY